MNEKRQYIGSLTWWLLGGITIVHVLSFFLSNTPWSIAALIFIGVIVFFITHKSLVLGLIIGFTEIFTGGHGHLIGAEICDFSVSLRMVIFVAIMLAWGIQYIQGRHKWSIVPIRDIPWLVIVIAIGVGTIIGLLHHQVGIVFDDMNGYFTIGYIFPIITEIWNQKKKRMLFIGFIASMIWICVFTIILGFLFTHLSGESMHILYTFVRDARLAEVTLQVIQNQGFFHSSLIQLGLAQVGDYWYRIFMPAQTIVMVGVLLLFSLLLFSWRKSRAPLFIWAMLTLGFTTLAFSLSRSLWLGIGFGMSFIFFLAWFFGKAKWSIAYRSFRSCIIFIVSVLFLAATVHIPFPSRPDLQDATFFETSAQTGRQEAVASRWNLLLPMMEEIYHHPIIGSGFGEEITYQSEDPRVLEQEDGGVYTTYRFEWGWQDIWLKMGVLGLLGFCLYLWSLLRIGWFTAQNKGHKWLAIGCMGGILALFATHTFSPYLNHPIGISLMLFVLPFMDWQGFLKKQTCKQLQKRKKTVLQPSVSITASKIDL